MATLVIKNLPDELHARLREQAQRNHRSVSKEVVSLIESGLQAVRPPPRLSAPLKLADGRLSGIDEIEAAIAERRG